MVVRASPGPVRRVAISTGVVISSRTEVVCGSVPLSAILRRTSRSVKIPATRYSESTTATAPTWWSSILLIASATVASSGTAAISRSQSSSTLINTSSGSARGGKPDFRFQSETGLMNYARGEAVVKCIKAILTIFNSPGQETGILHSSRFFALEYLAIFHHELHVFQHFDVGQRIAVHRNDVGKRSGSNHADLAFHFEHSGGTRRCALDGVHGLHAQLDHARELLRDGLGPGNSPHIGAENNLHPAFERLLERLLMHRSAQPVALSGWRVRRGPVAVIHADRRDIPRALLQHLGNRGIIEIKAMFDRVA